MRPNDRGIIKLLFGGKVGFLDTDINTLAVINQSDPLGPMHMGSPVPATALDMVGLHDQDVVGRGSGVGHWLLTEKGEIIAWHMTGRKGPRPGSAEVPDPADDAPLVVDVMDVPISPVTVKAMAALLLDLMEVIEKHMGVFNALALYDPDTEPDLGPHDEA